MAEKEYRIYIHNVVEQDKQETPEEQVASLPTPEKAKDTGKKAETSAALLVAQQIGKEALGFALQNYGDLTGDYTTQKLMQFGLGVAGDISSIVIAGIATGGTGAIVAGVGVGIKYGMQGVNYGFDILKQQQRANILKERLGNASIGGDRR